MDAARGHALMGRFNHHGHALWLQHLFDGIRHLCRQLFLDLQALGINFQHARQLADAHHAALGQIGDMRAANDGHHVVFAMAFHADVPQDHHFIIAIGFFEGPREQIHRVCLIAGEEFLIGAGDARGRVHKAFAVRVITGPAQQGAHRGFRFRAGGARFRGGGGGGEARGRHLNIHGDGLSINLGRADARGLSGTFTRLCGRWGGNDKDLPRLAPGAGAG